MIRLSLRIGDSREIDLTIPDGKQLSFQSEFPKTLLWLENVDNAPVEATIADSGYISRVRLYNVSWSARNAQSLEDTIDLFDACSGIDADGNPTASAVVVGHVDVPSIPDALVKRIYHSYPDLIVSENGVNKYVAEFISDGTTVYEYVFSAGGTVIDPVATGRISAPTRAETAGGIRYWFSGWDVPLNLVLESTQIHATFGESYRVRYLNWNSDVLYTVYVRRGEDATYSGNTPTKPQDGSDTVRHYYTFSGWSGTQTNITSVRDITAQFSDDTRYRVRYLNWNDDVLYTVYVSSGGSATYVGNTPTKPATETETEKHEYTFNSWSGAQTNVTSARDITAVYDDDAYYRVRYVNWNGNVLYSVFVHSGGDASYVGDTPTRPATETDSERHTYTFSGWTGAQTNITSVRDITAAYSDDAYYRVRYVNWDDTVLYSVFVHVGGDASYVGDTPTRPSTQTDTEQHVYTFSGWSGTQTNITSARDISAVYTDDSLYRVRYLNWDDTVLYTVYVIGGGTASYVGNTPTKPQDAHYSYTFSGWSASQENISAVTDLVAVFTNVVRTYTVTWKNTDNSVLETDTNVPWGTVPTYDGTTPQHPTASDDWLFRRWLPEVGAITGDTTYTAVYLDISAKTVKYLVGALKQYDSDANNIVGKHAFRELDTLETVDLEKKTVEEYAFYGCDSLASGEIQAGYVGTNAFYGCLGLTSLRIEETNLDASAFEGCNNLTSLTISKTQGDLAIPSQAFTYCQGLQTVDLSCSSGAITIGDMAFYMCPSLETLIIRCNSVATLAYNSAITWTRFRNGTGKIYVPSALVATYKTATDWSSVASSIYSIDDYPSGE